MSDDLIVVGRIGKPRGVRGETFVAPWTDDPDERFAAGSVLVTEPADTGPLTVLAMSSASGKLVVHFENVDSREAAEALRGVSLLIAPGERPTLADPDDFYDTDLIGLDAHTVDGTALGPVRDVLHAGSAVYLVVSLDGHEHLIPFVNEIVPDIDLDARTVRITPPDGLFDL